MEQLRPGQYKFLDGAVDYKYLKGETFPHRLSVSVGINGEASNQASRGVHLTDALRALDRRGREYAKRKAEQLAAPETLQKGLRTVEEQFEQGELSLEEAGQRVQGFVGSFIQSHKENLPDLVHVAPVWRVNTATNSLQRPWKVDENIPEPYAVWFTNRGLIANALQRKVKRAVL